MIATLWAAPGVLLNNNRIVPNPPPRVFRIALYVRQLQHVEFALGDWSPTGGIAHYDLVSAPPAGWRWIVHNGNIAAERIAPDPA